MLLRVVPPLNSQAFKVASRPLRASSLPARSFAFASSTARKFSTASEPLMPTLIVRSAEAKLDMSGGASPSNPEKPPEVRCGTAVSVGEGLALVCGVTEPNGSNASNPFPVLPPLLLSDDPPPKSNISIDVFLDIPLPLVLEFALAKSPKVSSGAVL